MENYYPIWGLSGAKLLVADYKSIPSRVTGMKTHQQRWEALGGGRRKAKAAVWGARWKTRPAGVPGKESSWLRTVPAHRRRGLALREGGGLRRGGGEERSSPAG